MTIRLQELVPSAAIVCGLEARDRDAAIEELLDALVDAKRVPESLREDLLARVLERERKVSTGFGRGVAVPHVKHRDLDRISAAIGLTPEGIDFKSIDGQPVYSVVLLVSSEDRPEEHLGAMEALFKQLRKETFRVLLRQCEQPADVARLLQEADSEQVIG